MTWIIFGICLLILIVILLIYYYVYGHKDQDGSYDLFQIDVFQIISTGTTFILKDYNNNVYYNIYYIIMYGMRPRCF